jgi:outer membrane protein TolC
MSTAVGQGSTVRDTVRLSLAAVLDRVEAEHPVNRAGMASIQAAVARAAQLRRYENPALEIEHATFSEADNVALLQPIRWPWESSALNRLGAAEVSAATAGAEVDRRSVALDAAQRYVDVLRDERAYALAVEAESLAASAVERTVAARTLGQAGDLAVLQAQVSLDAASRSRLAAESELQSARATLSVVLGFDVGNPVRFDGDLAALAGLTVAESSSVAAKVTDPESARLEAEAAGATEQARLARARRWPEISLGPATNLGGKATIGFSMGIGIPIWDRQGAAIRAASADRDVALARRDVRQREIVSLVLEVSSTLSRVDRELTLLRGGELARARQAVELAARAMQAGGPFVTTWLTARQAYVDAQRAELDLEWEAARAKLVLRHLAGTLKAGEL